MAYSSRLANYLLYTPFDNKSNVNSDVTRTVTIPVFFDKYYSHPIFEQDLDYLMDDRGFYLYDSSTKQSDLFDLQDRCKTDYDYFLTWINNPENSKIHTISGNAGTGKTTFLNFLKYEINDFIWKILDVANADEIIDWLGDLSMNISDFRKPYSMMFAVVVNEIENIIFKEIDNNQNIDIEKIYEKLSLVIENYIMYFEKKRPLGETFFKGLCEIVTNNDDTKSIIVEKSAKFFYDYFEELNKSHTGHEKLIKSLDVFLLLIRCLSNNCPKDRIIIAFDNLERFIHHREIYNKDVDEIRKTLSEYSKKINKSVNCHHGKTKFIMAIRTSTARMCGVKLHSSDELPSNLSLSNWYSVEDIINRKKDLIQQSYNRDYLDTIEYITGDIRKCSNNIMTGLKLELDPLFNYNKRLMIDFIGMFIEKPSNKKNISLYLRLWREDTSVSRFAARNIIKGIILRELEKNDNLFKNLKTYREDNIGSGHARKILTILFNHEISAPNENDIALSDILCELFRINSINDAWGNIDITQKELIAELLFYMNSYNRRENDWIQFIDMQYDDADYNIIFKNSQELLNSINNNYNKFRIKLTNSGKSFLLYIVSSFEYFSARYCNNYHPLFATIPNHSEINTSIKINSLECIKILKTVSKNAIKCIEKIDHDVDIKININTNTTKSGMYHRDRIIAQHIGYIDKFINYINEYIHNNSMSRLSRSNYHKIISTTYGIRRQYYDLKSVEKK